MISRDGFWSDNDSVGFTIRATKQQDALRRREREIAKKYGEAWVAELLGKC